MSEARHTVSESQLSRARRVDEACYRFEAAWKAATSPDRRPCIEDYLADTPEPERSELLRELILVDLFHRRRCAEDPQPADYHARFPALDLAWLADALAARPAGEPGTAAAAEKPATDEPVDGELTATSRGRRVRCPHCLNPIQLSDDHPDEVLCPGCGSSFRIRDARPTATVTEMRPLGKFQLLERVGLGAFGAVWRARDTELDRVVALKIPHSGLVTEGAELERFRREARAAARLRHPGIVTVYEVATLNGLPVIVSDFVDGVPLKDVLELRRLTFREAATLVAEVALALDYAHRQGLIHRDIKPANIMLESAARSPSSLAKEQVADTADYGPRTTDHGLKPLILDFGLALRQEAEITITLDGQIIGTPAYMSPEQARGKGHEADPRSDIYSLGVVLYELLCGELPFRGSRVMMLQQVLHEEPRPPRRVNDKIPRDLETICLKALAKEPSRRYGTAGAMADDLHRFLKGEAISARAVGRLEKAWRWTKRRPALAGLIATLFMVATIGFPAVVVLWRQADRARSKAESAESLATQRAEAEAEAKQALDRNLYYANVALAYREWQAGHLGRAEQLLDQCPPELRDWEWHYTKRLCRSELLTLRGHAFGIASVEFSPSGKQILSASGDGTVKVWNAETGQVALALQTAIPFMPESSAVARFSPDGQRIATAVLTDSSNRVRIWDAATGKNCFDYRGHMGPVFDISFSADGRWIASAGFRGEYDNSDGEIRIWDPDTGNEKRIFREQKGGIKSIAFSPDGRRLVAGVLRFRKGVIPDGPLVWDIQTGKELLRLRGHSGGIFGVAFSPDGRRMASAGFDGTVRVWDATTGQDVFTFRGHSGPVTSALFSPDSQRIVSTSWDRTVKVWEVATGKELYTFRGHNGGVWSGGCSPDGRLLVSGVGDQWKPGVVKLWNAATTQEALSFGGQDLVSNAGVAFSRDRKQAVTGGSSPDYQEIRVWDLTAGKRILQIPKTGMWPRSVAFTPDGRRFAAAGAPSKPASGVDDSEFDETKGVLKIWDAKSGMELLSIESEPSMLISVAFSPDGEQVAAGREDKSITIWDSKTATECRVLKGHTRPVKALAFSPDGRMLASAGLFSGLAHLAAGEPYELAEIKIWDTATGQELRVLKGHHKGINCLTFSRDGKWLASASNDRTIRIWEWNTGREVLVLVGHSEPVRTVSFSPDGRRLASGSVDHTVRLWNLSTGQEAFVLHGPKHWIYSVAFSPDGHRLLAGAANEAFTIWDATPLPEDVALENKAQGLVDTLYDQLTFRDDVVEALNNDSSLTEPLRRAALRLARARDENLTRVDAAIWEMLRRSTNDSNSYQTALRRAEGLHRLVPDHSDYLTTLGVAQYRAGKFHEAVEILTQSNKLHGATAQGSLPADLAFLAMAHYQPADLAFLAMAHYQLGHGNLALGYLERLQGAMKDLQRAKDEASQGFLREAEALIAGSATPTRK